MKNIYILPTDKPSRLHLGSSDLILCDLVFNSTTINSQNIYITSDEVIKEGDWFIELDLKGTRSSYINKPYLCDIGNTGGFILTKNNGNFPFPKHCKKIILTTDIDLIKDGVQAIDDEFLEWFVKNPTCEWVEVIKVPYFDESGYSYLLVIPKRRT
jgi:hypothetical protein